MILDATGAQDLQKYGDMTYKNGSELERVQGYLFTKDEVDEIVHTVKEGSG